MTDRLLLVATSPRLPAGLLSWHGWQALRCGPVFAGGVSSQVTAVRATGIDVALLAGQPAEQAAMLRERAREHGTAVWLAGPDGDPATALEAGLAQAAAVVARPGAR